MKKSNETLTLSPDEMRQAGYQAVDLVVEHLANLESKPVTRRATREEMETLFREPLPENGSPTAEVLAKLEEDFCTNIMHLDHPRFFAFVSSPGNFVGALADFVASGFNVFAGTWLESSAAAEIEMVTIDWLKELAGFPAEASGLFVSGGSMANLTALAVAREARLKNDFSNAVVYCSEQTHSSIDRGVKVLGFAPNQLKKLPVDEHFRLRSGALKTAVKKDREQGKKPFCVIANIGTTNTGAVDPLSEIAEICRAENLWLHGDGAYGAAALLSPKFERLFEGVSELDSLTLDPHKWLFQPYSAGCVLVREGDLLRKTFDVSPEYLKDAGGRDDEVNFFERGVELTRGFRALKLWASFKVFGAQAFREAIEHGVDLAEYAEKFLRSLPSWQVCSSAQLGVITFRFKPAELNENEANAVNASLIPKIIDDGFAMLSTTILNGKILLRMCIINPRTTERDIADTILRLERMAKSEKDEFLKS